MDPEVTQTEATNSDGFARTDASWREILSGSEDAYL
jgi:hypothetical protein